MAYTLNLTNGAVLTTLADGTTDSNTTILTLIGKNTTGYGTALNDNFIRILENSAKSSAPVSPLEGQLWWDSSNKQLLVYQGAVWKSISHSESGTTAPSAAPLAGDLWWDNVNSQLRGYSGSTWLVIGPQTPPGVATTALQANAVTDSQSISHTVGNLIINNKLSAILSTDSSAFSTSVFATSGITKINPGLNFTATSEPTMISSPNAVFGVSAGNVQITALSSNYGFNITANIGGTSRSVFYVSGSTGDTSFTGNVSFPSVSPISISKITPSSGTLIVTGALSVTGAAALGSSLSVANTGTFGNITTTNGVFWANGTPYSSGSGGATVLTNVSSNIVPSANLTYNLGSTSAWWNNIYGTAIHAQYADLAERFAADAEYSPGTVMELGGVAEITAAAGELSESVFGVISTRAAYLMNSGAGTDQTHPPIAVQGRVPVKVIGKIRKGDRLVSAGNGTARAGTRSEITTWNVIGRALENKTDDGLGVIEAVVKLNS